MKTKIYIDGSEGTTGLRINERFQGRDDIEILTIPSELRKDLNERKKYINASDITFLCLPDAASIEAVSLVENENVELSMLPLHIELTKDGHMVSLNYQKSIKKRLSVESVLQCRVAMLPVLFL